MKHGKRPTKAQRAKMRGYRLNPENWLVVKDSPDLSGVVNRVTGRIREYPIKWEKQETLLFSEKRGENVEGALAMGLGLDGVRGIYRYAVGGGRR